MTAPSVTAAERERDTARERVTATLGEIQERLDPRVFARNAARDVAEAGNALAATSVQTARSNPGLVAGATAVAGLFLARHRIAVLFRRKPKVATDTGFDPN